MRVTACIAALCLGLGLSTNAHAQLDPPNLCCLCDIDADGMVTENDKHLQEAAVANQTGGVDIDGDNDVDQDDVVLVGTGMSYCNGGIQSCTSNGRLFSHFCSNYDICDSMDWNNDGAVDGGDLTDYTTDFFDGFPPCADVNGDGLTNADDLSDFITTFFFIEQNDLCG